MEIKSNAETRGGANRRKRFTWWYQTERGILNIENEDGLFHRFHLDESLQILESIKLEFGREYFPLANNVEKLGKGTEKRGLGTIILDLSPGDITHAQGASYFGPVFEQIGFFEWNGKNRGIEWRLVNYKIAIEAIIQRMQNNSPKNIAIIERTQNGDLRDPEEIKLQNIVDMGLTFSAMIRLYEKGTKQTLHNIILEELPNISKATSKEAFEIIHSNLCKWGIKNLTLAEKARAGKVIKKKGPAGYGQIAKTLDVVLKVVIHYCHHPIPEKSNELSQWLHAAVDTKMMGFLKGRYSDYFLNWPTSVEDVNEKTYLKLQRLVNKFIKDEHDGNIIPVQFDDIYWNILNRYQAMGKKN
jgi:hypothetical protein